MVRTRQEWLDAVSALRSRLVSGSGIHVGHMFVYFSGCGAYFQAPAQPWYDSAEEDLGIELQADFDPDRFARITAEPLTRIWAIYGFERVQQLIDVIDAGQWTDSEGGVHVLETDPAIRMVTDIGYDVSVRDHQMFDLMMRLPL